MTFFLFTTKIWHTHLKINPIQKISPTRIEINYTQVEIYPKIKPNLSLLLFIALAFVSHDNKPLSLSLSLSQQIHHLQEAGRTVQRERERERE